MFKRKLNIEVPPQQSIYLWGARQTGKTSYLKANYPSSVYYDLLNTHELVKLSKSPYLLREEILELPQEVIKHPIIIDEIQKVPDLLNEIHLLIETKSIQFILCGSSARQLKTSSTNLLGGRAWAYHFYPLSFCEIEDFDLFRALRHGLIPKHYLADNEYLLDYLQAYVDIYLTEEIRNEGLVRNLRGFARFLDVAGLCSGEMINMSNVARDCGIDRVTVQSYFQILNDTLLGYYIYPYRIKVKRDLIYETPRFYLFDVGIANYLAKRFIGELKGEAAGKALEHYILMELQAYLGLNKKRQSITYWRTKTGLEVDFVVGNAEIALEVKISDQVHAEDIKGLIAFCEEHPESKAYVISMDRRPRLLEINNTQIHIFPWRHFLEELWAGNIC